MFRDLKVLGTALTVAIAIGSLVAPAVSAHTPALVHSDSATGKTIFTGESVGPVVLKAAGVTMTCFEVKSKVTLAANTAADILTTLTYKECVVHLGGFTIPSMASPGACAYTVRADGTGDFVNNPEKAKTCAQEPTAFHISNFIGTCFFVIGPQNNIEKGILHGTSTVQSPPSEIIGTSQISGIKGTATGGLCPIPGEFKNGTIEGKGVAKGLQENVDGTEGAQVPIWITHTVA